MAEGKIELRKATEGVLTETDRALLLHQDTNTGTFQECELGAYHFARERKKG